MKAVVVGRGFLGRAVASALESRGHEVELLGAPRYTTSEREVAGIVARAVEIAAVDPVIELSSVDAIINCAGLATPTQGLTDALVGANALLPAVLAATIAREQTSCRLVHVSSASVQGAGVLDESSRVSPWSPYSQSKALGEQALGQIGGSSTIYRPASVHGPTRALTESLVRFASSTLSSVGGAGDGPSPVAHVANVADGIAFVAACADPPTIALQPSDGLTCAEVLRVLGQKEPHHVPAFLARTVIGMLRAVGALSPRSAAIGRRLEVTWFGQNEQAFALVALGWTPVVGVEEWQRMARQLGVVT